MDILGIGIPELVFIILIALIVLGPKDMQKTGKTLAHFMRKITTSPEWRTIKDVSKQARTLQKEWEHKAESEVESLRDDLAIENNLLTEFEHPKMNVPSKEESIVETSGEVSKNQPTEGERDGKNG